MSVTSPIPICGGGTLEIQFERDLEKTRILAVTVKVRNIVSSFKYSQIWINNQPARFIKGFKAELPTIQFYNEVRIHEGTLYLSHTDPNERVVKIIHNKKTHELNVTPQLKIGGLYEMIRTEFNTTDFKLYDHSGEFYEKDTLQTCFEQGRTSLTVLMQQEQLVASLEPATSQELSIISLPFTDFQSHRNVKLDPKAPDYLTLARGLTLEGICTNSICSAHEEWVCDPKGFGVFHMHETTAKASCPACKNKLSNVTTCLFFDCLFSIEGQQANANDEFRREEQRAPSKGNALKFESQGNLTSWKRLVITTSPVSSCTLI